MTEKNDKFPLDFKTTIEINTLDGKKKIDLNGEMGKNGGKLDFKIRSNEDCECKSDYCKFVENNKTNSSKIRGGNLFNPIPDSTILFLNKRIEVKESDIVSWKIVEVETIKGEKENFINVILKDNSEVLVNEANWDRLPLNKFINN